MAYTVEQVVEQYIKLRDTKAEIAARHKEELAPYSDAMDKLEAWLLQKMQETGVESFKTNSGTAFKARSASVTIADGAEFKDFVMKPVITEISRYFEGIGVELEPHDYEHIKSLLIDAPRWSLTDVRAAKKGIQEFVEETRTEVPGINMSSVLSVNVRRS